ncbi:MAG: glutamate--tRNA ligase [Henriciella sp.]
MSIVTRFAPSPTGMLHIGGARTALFNALLARHHKGKFLLRVEDTDKARSTPEATQAILEGLEWLGLNPDEAPVFQSQNVDRHIACALSMVESGAAFRCYATTEELKTRRELGEEKRAASRDESLSDAEKAKLLAEAKDLLAPFRSPWRDNAAAPAPDAPHTIRLRAPDTGEITIDDKVQGRVSLSTDEIDDLILLRADGTPTYMLAVVVDDYDMGVTHVLRGDDHFRNTFRQAPIYQAMGWPLPQFAHVPLIHGDDGAKLSKRHGALSTLAYREMGYLPEAMLAYLLRLGWSHGDQEIFSWDQAIEVFSMEGLNKAPSRLDLVKLGDINAHFMRQSDEQRLLTLMRPLIEAQTELDAALEERLLAALPVLKKRGTTILELTDACRFLWDANSGNLNKKARKALNENGLLRLKDMRQVLDSVESWSADLVHNAIQLYCEINELSMGQVGPPLRAALTGGLPAPDLAPVIVWLGREEVMSRIKEYLPD